MSAKIRAPAPKAIKADVILLLGRETSPITQPTGSDTADSKPTQGIRSEDDGDADEHVEGLSNRYAGPEHLVHPCESKGVTRRKERSSNPVKVVRIA